MLFVYRDNILLKYLKCNITFIFIMLTINNSISTFETKREAVYLGPIAKRNFLLKEREYLHNNPLSNDMKLFIRRFKRKADVDKKREINADNMYVVQDGDIIPLKSLASAVGSDDQSGDFTVIPLIIPISANSEESSTDMHSDTEEAVEETTEESVADETTVETNAPIVEEQGTVIPTTLMAIIHANIETTTKEKEYLNKVIEDFKDLITHEKEGPHSNEGTPCSVVGDWDSDVAGMQIRIENICPYKLAVTVIEREPPMEGGLLCKDQWDISGQDPFAHSSLIVLTAISKSSKKVASFIGECQICEGAETIVGNWMEGRSAKNCKDRLAAHTFYSDVFRKNNIRKLQQAHMQEISSDIS